MNVLLLSGGSGKRLWPLSNDIRSKQFLKLFAREGEPDGDAERESMLQRVHRQITSVSPDAHITIATGETQKAAILHQLGDRVDLCVEPSRRDTFPAIALGVCHMLQYGGLSRNDVVIVCPIDPYVGVEYFQTLLLLEKIAHMQDSRLCLMGAKPTYPSEKYGYILPQATDGPVKRVRGFKEKPDAVLAMEYIAQGALWNCGVFAFRAGYILDVLAEYCPYTTYDELCAHYPELPKTSFDYAVAEKEAHIRCVEYAGPWKDLGTWNTLIEELPGPSTGNVVMDDACQNTYAINEQPIPMLVMGAQNLVVVASPDGILVSDLERSSQIKPYVDRMTQPIMYEEKAWGDRLVLGQTAGSVTTQLQLRGGACMCCDGCTASPAKTWVVLEGGGSATVGTEAIAVAPGSTVSIPKGVPHALYATTEMTVVEVRHLS